MAPSFDLAGTGVVGLTRDALVALRSVLFRDAGGDAAAYLQEAGYAGGGALYEAFTKWSAERGIGTPESIPFSEFERRAGQFFNELGWGGMSVNTLHDSVVTVDSPDWAESDPSKPLEFPGCYLSAGMLADFFGRLAGAQLAVMEVECRSMGSSRCRFLLGSTETMQHVYDEMTRGVGYEKSLEQMS